MRSPSQPVSRMPPADASTPTVCENTAWRGSYCSTAERYAGRCEKNRPLKQPVPASSAQPTSTCLLCVRSSSRNGCRDARLCMPLELRRLLERAAQHETEHAAEPAEDERDAPPVDRHRAPDRGSVRTDRLTPVAAATPIVTHANTTPQTNGAIFGAVSTT